MNRSLGNSERWLFVIAAVGVFFSPLSTLAQERKPEALGGIPDGAELRWPEVSEARKGLKGRGQLPVLLIEARMIKPRVFYILQRKPADIRISKAERARTPSTAMTETTRLSEAPQSTPSMAAMGSIRS